MSYTRSKQCISKGRDLCVCERRCMGVCVYRSVCVCESEFQWKSAQHRPLYPAPCLQKDLIWYLMPWAQRHWLTTGRGRERHVWLLVLEMCVRSTHARVCVCMSWFCMLPVCLCFRAVWMKMNPHMWVEWWIACVRVWWVLAFQLQCESSAVSVFSVSLPLYSPCGSFFFFLNNCLNIYWWFLP